jgi:hypothetical protein
LLQVRGGREGKPLPFCFRADDPFFPYAEPHRRAVPASIGESSLYSKDEDDPLYRFVFIFFPLTESLVRPAQFKLVCSAHYKKQKEI